jgi:hypothetical protein
MNGASRIIAVSGILATAVGFQARADVVLSGPDSNDGSYSTTQLATAAGGNTVSSGGLTGISLWAFLGGANAANSGAAVYGAITTSTPAGDDGKNAILRYYLVATNATGQQSVVSLGEIDPNFGGTAATPAFIAYQNTPGGTPELVLPNQPGRDLTNLTSVQIMSVPALTQNAEGIESSSIVLSGNVKAPGSYTAATLSAPANFTAVTENIGGDNYTGVGLWSFLNSKGPVSTNQIVITAGTDGYEVVVALAELDPSLGAVACGVGVENCDLLPYADTGTAFPGDALARTIYPTDNAHGRWESNLDLVTVETVPEPGTLTLFAVALAAIGTARRRLNPRTLPA